MHSQGLSQRASTPSDLELARFGGPRPPNPGDVVAAAVDALHEGNDEGLFEEDDEDEDYIPATNETCLPGTPVSSPAASLSIPPPVAKLLGTSDEAELIAAAKIIAARRESYLTLLFHTPIGDVKIPVVWTSHDPAHLSSAQGLIMVMVRSSDTAFRPAMGAELKVSFQHHPHEQLNVVNLSSPLTLYRGVEIDLLCFLSQNDDMEKQGVVKERAPSVVSGRPSDHVDEESGEPVVEGEKSASLRDPEKHREELPREDFDRPRS